MIISILNTVMLIVLIAVILFIFVNYYAIRDDLRKMQPVIPKSIDITDPMKSIVVPIGPKL